MEGPLVYHHDEEESNCNSESQSPVLPIKNKRRQSCPNLTKTVENCCTIVHVDLSLTGIPDLSTSKIDDETKVFVVEDHASNNNNDNNGRSITASTKNIKAPPPWWKRYIGICLALLSCLTFSLAVLIVKSMTEYHPFSLAVWRFVGIIVFSAPFLFYNEYKSKTSLLDPIFPLSDPIKRKTFINLMLRGILGTSSSVLQYVALTYMEIGDCTVIVFSTPVFVTVIAFLVLGETFSIVSVLAALLTFGGVVIIARPPFLTGAAEFDYDLTVGTIISFISMCFATSVFIVLRFLRKINFAVVTTSFGIIGFIECFILCCFVSRLDLPRNSWDWFRGTGIGLFTFLGQLFFTSAMKFETSSTISLIRTNDVIFSFMWQLILLNVIPDFYSLLGATVVISGVLIVGFVKWLDQLPRENLIRKRLWFLLK